MIGEILSSVISETVSIKETGRTCETTRRAKSGVEVGRTQKGRIVQRRRPNVR